MSLKDLPKSLVDAVASVVSESERSRQTLYDAVIAEGLKRFGIKKVSNLTEVDLKALYAWTQAEFDRRLVSEASCGCSDASESLKEDDMPNDAAMHVDGDEDAEKKKDMSEEDADEVSEEDEVELKENVAVDSTELATNGAVAVGDAASAMPKHADVIRDTDPVNGVTEYRLLLQYATNDGTRIYPPAGMPGAKSVADLRTLVDGLPEFNEAVDAALVRASETADTSAEQ